MPAFRLDDLTPELPPSCWIAPGAAVIGNVRLGENVGVWFGAVLRGDKAPIDIGARSNIQDMVMIHADPGFPTAIGEGCTIGHRAIVHGCTIGDNSLVGMGAVILNGARIGSNCLIGAGAIVTEGKEIPDGSLVIGAPGKVARALTEEQIEGLRRSARGYVENARRFAQGLQVRG
ncbi:gamma carbonic anhydrase family protein [Paracoccus sp. SSK6]|uniref:gamma carbonic anhydrase family protein n=1 Tax=Paracoccus sp. SSK6 TaxID=3143131 RepID=UPI003219E4D6